MNNRLLLLLMALIAIKPEYVFATEKIDGAILDFIKNNPAQKSVSALVFFKDSSKQDFLNEELAVDRHRIGMETMVAEQSRGAAKLLEDFPQLLDVADDHIGEHVCSSLGALNSLWIANAIYIKNIPTDLLDPMSEHNEIEHIFFNYEIETISPIDILAADNGHNELSTTNTIRIEPNLLAIEADKAWYLGFFGQDVLVSAIDTGVSAHRSLIDRWRGFDPRYIGHSNWAYFDPVPGTNWVTPKAFGQHGTHVMGIICGDDPSAFRRIGVAPKAQWIAAAAIDRCTIAQTIADAILALQWIVDPDSNPATVFDVPTVCGNSWGLRTDHGVLPCDPLIWRFVINAEALGVAMIFAAGNEGFQEVRRPADNINVTAVGATNNGTEIALFSSRGPTQCGANPPLLKPNVSAPGFHIYSSVGTESLYIPFSGTSMATPHVVGALALMKEAMGPNITVETLKNALFREEVILDLGEPGPDNDFGVGRIRAGKAISYFLSDLNKDGFVTYDDVSIILTLLGNRGEWPLPGDIKRDGIVDILDLLEVLSHVK